MDADRGRASGEGPINGIRWGVLLVFVILVLFPLVVHVFVVVFVVFFLFVVVVAFAFRVSRVIALCLDASSKLNLESFEVEFFQREECQPVLVDRRCERLFAGCFVCAVNAPHAEPA